MEFIQKFPIQMKEWSYIGKEKSRAVSVNLNLSRKLLKPILLERPKQRDKY